MRAVGRRQHQQLTDKRKKRTTGRRQRRNWQSCRKKIGRKGLDRSQRSREHPGD